MSKCNKKSIKYIPSSISRFIEPKFCNGESVFQVKGKNVGK